MSISPVTFVAAAPIRAIERVERVKRRAKSALDDEEQGVAADTLRAPTFAAASAEQLASDATREGLLSIRLGG